MTDTISHEINNTLRSNNMMYTTEILKAVEKGKDSIFNLH